MIAIVSVLSIIIPVLSLPFVIICLLLDKNVKNKKIYCIIFSVIIAVLMYNFVPDENMDLYRYYLIMNRYKDFQLSSFLQYASNGIEPLMNFIFYIFSKTGDNHLIMIFTTLVSYLIQIFIIFDYQKEKKLNNFQLNIILIFFLSTFLIIYHISGVRLCLARLIFMLALYIDYYKGKKNALTLLLYIIPIFIHQSSIILLFIRLLLFINKNRFDYKFIILFIVLFIAPNIIFSFSDYLSSNFSSLGLLSQRADTYINAGNDFANIYKLQFALLLFLFFVIIWIKIKKIDSNNKMINFTLITLFIGLFFVNSPAISTRFISISTSFSVLVLMDIIGKVSPKNRLFLSVCLLLFSGFYSTFQVIQLRLGTYPELNKFNPKIFLLSTLILLFSILIIKSKKEKGYYNE